MALKLTMFFISLAVYVVVGILVSKRAKSLDQFYVAGRNAGPIFICGTFAATWLSAVGILGYPGWSWAGGIPAVIVWGAFPGFVLACLTIAPKLYRSQAWTLFDFFAKRWDSPKLATVGIVFLFLGLMPYLLGQIIGAGTILTTLLGIDYQTIIIFTSVVFCLITFVGGAWSVTVTDTIMLFVVFFAAFFCLPFAISWVGGWDVAVTQQFIEAPERFQWTGSKISAGTVFSTGFVWLFGMFVAPHQSSRVMIAKNETTAIKGIMLAIMLGFCAVWCFHMSGSALWSVQKDLTASGQALPYLFANMKPGWVGMVGICGLFAACLSTATTMLLVLGQGVGRDVYQRFINPNAEHKKVLKITRIAIVVIAVLIFFMAYFEANEINKWSELGGSVYGCTFFWPLILGLNWKRTTKTAVFWSMILGGGTDVVYWILWRYFGAPLLFGTIQPVIWGVIVSGIVMIVVTLMTNPTAKEIEEFNLLQRPRRRKLAA